MKIIRQNIRAPRSDDTVGRGMDIAFTVGLFFVIGLVLDRWLGTTPLFMITLTVLAVVGFFISLKYRYTARDGAPRGRARRAGRALGKAAPVSTVECSDRSAELFTTQLDGPATEVIVSRDMIKRGLIVAPLLIAICAVIWGGDGALVGGVRHRPRARQLRPRRGDHLDDGAHLARPRHGGDDVRLPDPPRPHLPRRLRSSRTPAGFHCRPSERPSSSRTSACCSGR